VTKRYSNPNWVEDSNVSQTLLSTFLREYSVRPLKDKLRPESLIQPRLAKTLFKLHEWTLLSRYLGSLLSASTSYQTLPLQYLACLLSAKRGEPLTVFTELFVKAALMFQQLAHAKPFIN
jgi:hypothetical protein